MRKKSFILFLLLISHVSLFSQNSLTGDALLEKQIYETGFIHAPLPLDTSRSFEENALKKEVLSSQPFTETDSTNGWTHSGTGSMAFSNEKSVSGKGSIRLTFPTDTGKEQSVLLPTRTMQLMEIAVSPIMSMGKIGRNITESFFPSIRIVTAHV